MKKYIKPQLLIERMDLKTVILNACNTPSNQSDGAQCSYEIAGLGAVFVDENSDCDYTGMDDLVCYHNPESAENIIFGS